MIESFWCFLGTNQATSIITISGFALAFVQLRRNRDERRKTDENSLRHWRAEMYEESFANITLSWEEIHNRVRAFIAPYTYQSEKISEQLSEFELRLIEVRFRLRGSDKLKSLVANWRDSAINITHGCAALKAELTVSQGVWQEKDRQLLAEIQTELSKMDRYFEEIETGVREELKFSI